jgi:hypothetical protein
VIDGGSCVLSVRTRVLMESIYTKHKSELTSRSKTTGALREASLVPASFFHDKPADATS